jgi:YebC/PmpR family DNA-binding regulatory protein
MSGHSKWATIKHKKGAADAKRGKIFSKLAKAIAVAARDGDDPAMNFSLRVVIDKAKAANMPKDNIERAIARGSGKDGSAQLESVVYEAMGPGGASMIIEGVTDNTNRTFTNVKTIVNKNGGNMDAQVMWQFERKGVVRAEELPEEFDKDTVELALIDAGAEDLTIEDGQLEVVAGLGDLQALEKAVTELGIKVSSAEPEYVADNMIELDESKEKKLMNVLELLDEDDDVSNVYTNVA